MDIRAIWSRWVGVLAKLRETGDEIDAQYALLAAIEERAAEIPERDTRTSLARRLVAHRAALNVIRSKYHEVRVYAEGIHRVLRYAYERLAPGEPAPTGGVGAFSTAAIVAAVGSIGVVIAALATLSYLLGASKRNLQAEQRIVDRFVMGDMTSEDAAAVIDALQPDTGGAAVVGGVAGVALLVGGVFLASRYLKRGRR